MMNVVESKANAMNDRYECVVKADLVELDEADSSLDEAQVFVTANTDTDKTSNNGRIGFAAVIQLRNNKIAVEVSGVSKKETSRRAHLRCLVAALEVLKAHCHVKDVKFYVSDNYVYKLLTRGWLYRWMENGFVKNNGQRVSNMDLIKPLVEALYSKELRSIRNDFFYFKNLTNEEYSVRRCLQRVNKLSKENARELAVIQ